jgi:hypothetical protein
MSSYVFESYTDGSHIARDMDRKINWQAATVPEEAIPEETTRFIFVKGNDAVQYLDVSTSLVGQAHFKHYYPDTPGRVTTVFSIPPAMLTRIPSTTSRRQMHGSSSCAM